MQKTDHASSTKYYIYITFFALLAVVAVLLIESSNKQVPKQQKNPIENQIASPSVDQMAAIEDLQIALQSSPEEPQLNIQMANILFDIGHYQDAIPFYRTALVSEPKLMAAQIDLAICYYNLQILDSALVEIKKALIIDPQHVKGLFNIGVMYYNTAQVDSAKRYWQELIQIHPDTREAEVASEILNTLNI
jgi:tetratricopeptide (TPR) repeat protein